MFEKIQMMMAIVLFSLLACAPLCHAESRQGSINLPFSSSKVQDPSIFGKTPPLRQAIPHAQLDKVDESLISMAGTIVNHGDDVAHAQQMTVQMNAITGKLSIGKSPSHHFGFHLANHHSNSASH